MEPVSLPTEDLTERLVAIWAEVLETDAVDENSDYVEYDGTSLTAVRIRGRIRTAFGRDVDLLDILDYPTPKQLAAIVPRAPFWSGDEDDEGVEEA